MTASVATTDGAQAMVQHAIDTYGQLDIVINNAGTVPNGQGIGEVSDDEWARVLDVNLLGGVKVLRAAWPHLLAAPAGRIVNTSSSTVLGLPGALTYSTVKAAMIGLTKSVALETEGTSIKVNAIWPFGSIRMSSTDFATMFEGQYGLEPGEFNRTFTAEAVARAVAALSHTDTPSNGEVFATGGGRLTRIFFGATHGAVADAAEGYLQQWDQVFEPTSFTVPAHALDAEQAHISTDRVSWLHTA